MISREGHEGNEGGMDLLDLKPSPDSEDKMGIANLLFYFAFFARSSSGAE
jgi:hypothetical protein